MCDRGMANPGSWPRHVVQTLWGTRDARASRRAGLSMATASAPGVARFFDLAGSGHAGGGDRFDETPVFILSAGWRSGSTLLQRLVASGENVLIWGEPYDRGAVIQALAKSLGAFADGWPPDGYMLVPERLDQLSEQWTANLYPDFTALAAGYRALLLETFAAPARALGASRWGLKEVRFGLGEARLLKGLFPDARFLFIRRDLEAAYQSYRGFSGRRDWYAAWPDKPAFTPYAFARHWARLAAEFEVAAPEVGGILVGYEDLTAGRVDLVELGAYCGFDVARDVLEKRVGSGAERRGLRELSWLERQMLAAGKRAGGR